MSPHKSRLRRQKGTPKRQKSPRIPKEKSFQSRAPSSVSSSNNSPQFLWQSQEVHDGITWDCRSPMQLKLRSAKQHGKADVNDLLKCIGHEEVKGAVAPENITAEKRQRTSLLDTWISAGQTMISSVQLCQRSPQSGKKKINMRKSTRPRHLEKELQELSEALKKDDRNINNEEDETSLCCVSLHSGENADLRTDMEGLCDENSLDSLEPSEELWGADSESFLIQATQITEQAEDEYINNQLLQRATVPLCDISKQCLSCKDLTIATSTKNVSFVISDEKSLKENYTSRGSQIAKSADDTSDKNVTYQIDVAEDFWENDNSFDDILSSLSYDDMTLKSSIKENAKTVVLKNFSSNKHSASASRNNLSLKNANESTAENSFKNCHQNKISDERKNKSDDKRCLIISDKKSPLFSAISSMNLQVATTEWESDKFDEMLMQAEILTAVEQAESEALGSQKCTPEEIARKKAEALERRKKNHSSAHSRMADFGKQQVMWKDRLRSKAIDTNKQKKL